MRKLVLIIVAVVALSLTACANQQTKQHAIQNEIVGQDVSDINAQQRELRQNEPLPHFKDSAALHVQDAYYTADADPNKTWYVALIALDGTPYETFTTRGAPQPAGDQVTNPVQLFCQHNRGSAPDGCGTIGLPEPNGVHQGASNDGYVAILTTGAIKRFPSNADIQDQPFHISTPVRLSVDETKAISATDSSKTQGGVVPTGTSTRSK